MKKILNFLVICLFWILVFYITKVFFFFFLLSQSKFVTLFFGIYSTLFLISVFYKTERYKKLFSNRVWFVTFCLLVLTFFSYNYYLYYRSENLYNYFISKSRVRGWTGKSHKIDSVLGFSSIPNSRGFHTFPIGDPQPTAYDMDGFRVPLSDTLRINKEGNVDILFLGCSFTYGDACYADSTFAHLVAKEMNFKYINAGIGSYGLSQMDILSKRLIPKYKPKYVVFQYSSWLMDRALSGLAPVYYGSLPTPYYSKKDELYFLNKPMYETQIFNLDEKEIRKNFKSHFSFYLRKGLFFYLREDLNAIKMRIAIFFKINPPPAPNNQENRLSLAKQIYKEMIKTAIDNNCTPIILNLGNSITFDEMNLTNFSLSYFNGALLADGDKAHKDYLKENKYLTYKAFLHWRLNEKGDSILIDTHPNNLSHQLIAKSIVQSIKINNLKQ
jgi:hypothetical protein